ncbi:hypothetical protein SAMN04488144_103287 [Methylobacterium sp. 190mf]|nr:hypothetical protein SAMN04488144_103287 [Methylobacterium sp. 190mf]
MTDDMSEDKTASRHKSDAAMERTRKLVLDTLPLGPVRDRFAALTLDELRGLEFDSDLWRQVRVALSHVEGRYLN